MSKFAILLIVSVSLDAAQPVFTGSLQRVTRTAISIQTADGLVVDAVLPAGATVPYGLADQVEISCLPIKTTYDANTGLHFHLQLKSVRLLRPASPVERAEMIALLSWQKGENLLERSGAPIEPGEPAELERVRKVNLSYVAKMPDFVADEITTTYRSEDIGKAWRLQGTVEDEITAKDNEVQHRNFRRNGKPGKPPSNYKMPSDFGLQINAVFDPENPTKIEFGGREEAGGKPALVYLFQAPADGGFWNVGANGKLYAPEITGRIVVDAGAGTAVLCEHQGIAFPEKFGIDRHTVVARWDYATIAGASYLVPVWIEFVVRLSTGATGRITVEYKNHRHFEASTNVTFH